MQERTRSYHYTLAGSPNEGSVPAAEPLLRRPGSGRPKGARRACRLCFAFRCSGPAPPPPGARDAPKGSGSFEDALLCCPPGGPTPRRCALCLFPSTSGRIASGTAALHAWIADLSICTRNPCFSGCVTVFKLVFVGLGKARICKFELELDLWGRCWANSTVSRWIDGGDVCEHSC